MTHLRPPAHVRWTHVAALAAIGTASILYAGSGTTATSAGPPATPAQRGRITKEPEPAWNRGNGPPLDLTGYRLAWHDEFDSRRILAGDASGDTLWYAGSQGGPYGVANVGFSPRTDVYIVSNGVLTIRAHANVNAQGQRTGSWYSGHLQTVNRKGEGFAVREGYFEARMKFPSSLGAWPAFWLKHRTKWLDPDATNVEVDVVEWYGGDWFGHHHSVHVGEGSTRKFWSDYEKAGVDLSRDWHTHGALITRDWIVIYLDRIEIGRFPTPDAVRTPLYPQLTLSIQKQSGTNAVSPAAVSPMDLYVDYVRVWVPPIISR